MKRMNISIISLTMLLVLSIVSAIYEEEIYYDGDWKTYIVESREGYEEAIHWQEPVNIFLNYTKPSGKINYSLLQVNPNIKEKICLEWKVKNIIFDIQISKNVEFVPLDKIMVWKNITYDDFYIYEFKYKQCKV